MPHDRSASDALPIARRAAFARLRLALDEAIPPKESRRNLLMAAWNLGDLDELVAASQPLSGAEALGEWFAVRCVAEIASRFDVVAIQRVTDEGPALEELLRQLGEGRWGVLCGEGRRFSGYRDDRVAFLYDRHRVTPSGLACELIVLPGEVALPWDTFARQFTHTPFAASFVGCGRPFILVTAHLVRDPVVDDRAQDAIAVGRWLSRWAEDELSVGHSLLLLGDFAPEPEGDPRLDALSSCGLHVPSELREVSRAAGDGAGLHGVCEQIAWFTDGAGLHLISLEFLRAGALRFVAPLVDDLHGDSRRDRLPDLLPLWVEFGVG